jgi:hypothetical protein
MILLLKLKRFLSYAVFKALLLNPGVTGCERLIILCDCETRLMRSNGTLAQIILESRSILMGDFKSPAGVFNSSVEALEETPS